MNILRTFDNGKLFSDRRKKFLKLLAEFVILRPKFGLIPTRIC